MTSFRDPMLRRMDVVSFAPSGSLSIMGLTMFHSGRCGEKHEYFSEILDLALVKAVNAHAARQAENEDVVMAVFDARRAQFHAEERRDTSVELPDYVPAKFRTTHFGKLRKALYGTRPAAASWGDELRNGLVCLTVGNVSRCCFRNESCSVAGTGQCMVMTSLSLVLARTKRR